MKYFIFTANDKGQAKNYYVPRYFKSQWTLTRSICKAYDMDVLELETLDESNKFRAMCKENYQWFDHHTHIGAITLVDKSPTEWYWVSSGKKVKFALEFLAGEPDNNLNTEHCLSLWRGNSNNFMFNDIYCNVEKHDDRDFKFVCEKRVR